MRLITVPRFCLCWRPVQVEDVAHRLFFNSCDMQKATNFRSSVGEHELLHNLGRPKRRARSQHVEVWPNQVGQHRISVVKRVGGPEGSRGGGVQTPGPRIVHVLEFLVCRVKPRVGAAWVGAPGRLGGKLDCHNLGHSKCTGQLVWPNFVWANLVLGWPNFVWPNLVWP